MGSAFARRRLVPGGRDRPESRWGSWSHAGIAARIGPMEQTNPRQLGSSLPLGLGGALGSWRRGGGPLYRRLAAALGSAIERQALLPGTRLPPERVLAAHLAVARTTVSAAYAPLARQRDLPPPPAT